MGEETEFGLLVFNIMEENCYTHCRLCLESIKEDLFARFDDTVSYSESDEGVPLFKLLSQIFGEEICNEIPAVNAICNDCLDKTLQTYNLIQQYEKKSLKLHTVLDNLTSTLNIDLDSNGDQALYIFCHKEESRLILIEKERTKYPVSKVIHKCKCCKLNFDNINDLLKHNLKMHMIYTCEKCMYTSTNEAVVETHEESTLFYKCDECSQFRCTESSLKEHHDRTHSVYVCKECGKSCKGLDKLLAHEGKHMVKNECPKCGKSYTTKEYYERHVKLCLEDRFDPHPMRSRIEKTYFCRTCGKGYSTAGGLRVHERFQHGNAEHHICKECGKKFTAPCYLKAHLITHTKEKNFPCDLCQGKFVTKEALLYHRRRHTGEKPYSCDECGEKFVNASARVDHIKFKHVGPTLSCEYCSRKFVTKNILKNHMKKHHDPSNKLYIGRADVPHNVNGEQHYNRE